MTAVVKAWTIFLVSFMLMVVAWWLLTPDNVLARNISQYKDTISNSAPLQASNHTLSFTLDTAISPGSYLEITPDAGFEVLSTTTFAAERNIELMVGGVPRDADAIGGAGIDLVEIFPGSPGVIRYTLNPSVGIGAGAQLELKVGNHTSKSLGFSESYATTTGTTTVYADVKPIINTGATGTYRIDLKIVDGVEVADAKFVIAVVEQVGVGPIDTTEEIPPVRFNGSPTTTVTGVTQSVEIFVETNELAVCKFAREPGIDYAAMPVTFTNTGLIYHTEVVSVTPDSVQSFYIRCIDDEGNFNIDDYLLQFAVSQAPTGTSNEDGEVEGDGTGTGNNGTGSGSGGGGTSGQSDGQAPTEGGTSGGGGSGGGGGGGTGGKSGDTSGGGFESTDGPYRSGDGRVTIDGYTSPKSEVVILVDGKEAERVRSDSQGLYSATLDKIARGVYTFGIYALDPNQTKSSTFSTSFTVAGARTSALSNISIPPSVKINPDPVQPGQNVTVSGFTLPNASVAIENEKDKSPVSRQQFSATSDQNGAWSVSVPTANFSLGTYKARAKATQGQTISTSFSNYTLYGVGQAASRPLNADLNRDGKINLVDFSILLFWWNTNGGTSDPSADINADGKVNLVDFSILLFNWTG